LPQLLKILLGFLVLWSTVYSGSYAVFLLKNKNFKSAFFTFMLIFAMLVLATFGTIYLL